MIGHHDNDGDNSDDSDSDNDDEDEDDGNSGSESEEEGSGKTKNLEKLKIEEYKFIEVEPNNQYDRCVTDINEFTNECGYYPHIKLTF